MISRHQAQALRIAEMCAVLLQGQPSPARTPYAHEITIEGWWERSADIAQQVISISATQTKRLLLLAALSDKGVGQEVWVFDPGSWESHFDRQPTGAHYE